MKRLLNTTTSAPALTARGIQAQLLNMPFGPRIAFDAPNDEGAAADAAAAAAAAKEAADKTASETAAAEAAAKEAADKEAADKAANDKGPTDAEIAAAEALLEKRKVAADSDKDEAAKLLRETMSRKEKQRAAEDKLKEYGEITPEMARDLMTAKKAAELKEAEDKGEFDRVRAMMIEEAEKAQKALKDENELTVSENKALKAQIDDLKIGSQFGSSSYINSTLTLNGSKTRQLFGSHFEIQDGEVVGFNKAAGQDGRSVLVGQDGKPLSFDAALQRIVDADADKATIMRAKVVPGAASKSSDLKVTPKSTDGLYGASRIAAGLDFSK